MSDYQGRIKSQSQGKHGSRGAIWFVSVTSPSWTAGVDGIGASTWLHPGDTPDWVTSKRETLKQTLLEHAANNDLDATGLDAYLSDLLTGVQP